MVGYESKRYLFKKSIKTWCKTNAKINTYLITSFSNMKCTSNCQYAHESIKASEMRKRLTKSWYSAETLKNADKKQTKYTRPLTIWVTILLQGSEKDGKINLSNARVWIQTVFISKKNV